MSEPITIETVRLAFGLCLTEDPALGLADALEAGFTARDVEVAELRATLQNTLNSYRGFALSLGYDWSDMCQRLTALVEAQAALGSAREGMQE